ncbi:MAG: hypothetical protein ACJA2Q_001001 [Pseudohongiellaceae bacterium]
MAVLLLFQLLLGEHQVKWFYEGAGTLLSCLNLNGLTGGIMTGENKVIF